MINYNEETLKAREEFLLKKGFKLDEEETLEGLKVYKKQYRKTNIYMVITQPYGEEEEIYPCHCYVDFEIGRIYENEDINDVLIALSIVKGTFKEYDAIDIDNRNVFIELCKEKGLKFIESGGIVKAAICSDDFEECSQYIYMELTYDDGEVGIGITLDGRFEASLMNKIIKICKDFIEIKKRVEKC